MPKLDFYRLEHIHSAAYTLTSIFYLYYENNDGKSDDGVQCSGSTQCLQQNEQNDTKQKTKHTIHILFGSNFHRASIEQRIQKRHMKNLFVVFGK